MALPIKEKTNNLIKMTSTLGKVGLLIIENKEKFKKVLLEAEKILTETQYKDCADYLEIMTALSGGKNKIFYAEKGERLDGLVLEIIAEFEAGIVSLADRKNNSGLKTAKWNPANTSLVIIMTREQIENSYPHLFEYINIIQSI